MLVGRPSAIRRRRRKLAPACIVSSSEWRHLYTFPKLLCNTRMQARLSMREGQVHDRAIKVETSSAQVNLRKKGSEERAPESSRYEGTEEKLSPCARVHGRTPFSQISLKRRDMEQGPRGFSSSPSERSKLTGHRPRVPSSGVSPRIPLHHFDRLTALRFVEDMLSRDSGGLKQGQEGRRE